MIMQTTYAEFLLSTNRVTINIREVLLASEKDFKEAFKKHKLAIQDTVVGDKLRKYYFYLYIPYKGPFLG
jgi:hypothetical protein